MVIDGQEGPTFAVFQPAIFSQDGTHVGYIATKAQSAAGTFGSPPSVRSSTAR